MLRAPDAFLAALGLRRADHPIFSTVAAVDVSLEQPGTLPQSINFAVKSEYAATFSRAQEEQRLRQCPRSREAWTYADSRRRGPYLAGWLTRQPSWRLRAGGSAR